MPDDMTARLAELERSDAALERWARRIVRRSMAVVVVVVAVASWGTWRAEEAGHRAEAASDRVATESVDRQVAACGATNEFRRLFRDYLSGQAKGIDPARALELPGFTDLDPSAQAYVRSLVDLVNAGAVDAASALEDYRRNFPLMDCHRLRARLVLEAEG